MATLMERIAEERNVRVHCEASTMKQDFVSLLRVEALIGETRHHVSGTVMGQRHGRLVEFDDYVLDAIPEGPLLLTFHNDQPGVVGSLGTIVGEAGHNISRMQIGKSRSGNTALGMLNLDSEPQQDVLERVQAIDAVQRTCLIR